MISLSTTKQKITLLSTTTLIALVLLVVSLVNKDFAGPLVAKASYYVIFAMVLTWIFQIYKTFSHEGFRLKTFLIEHQFALIFCAVATLFIAISVPPKFRVLSDETNLLSVSQSMTYDKEVYNITEGKFFFENFKKLKYDLPTRPFLFPFFTQIIHSISGYRYTNVFVLNFITLFVLLLTLYLVIEPHLGKLSSISTVLLVLSIPTLTLSASSGGFDVFSLLFFVLAFVFLFQFMQEQTSERFGLLLIHLVLLSQIRYESIAYVVIILGALLVWKYIKKDLLLKNAELISVLPFFVLPMLIQRKLTPNTFENPPGVPPFAVEHFLKHGKIFLQTLVNFDLVLPYPTALNLLSLGLVLVFLIRILPKRKEYFTREQNHFIILILISVALSLVIVLSHHFGLFPHPTQARLFLIFLLFLSLMPVFFRYLFPQWINDRVLFGIALTSFVVYHPVAIQSQFTHSLTIIRETDDVYRVLKELNDPKILVVIDRPGQITVSNTGAVGFGMANLNRKGFIDDLRRGVFTEIIVFQKFLYDTGKPIADQTLEPEFELVPMKEFMVTATEFVRVSKVRHGFYPVVIHADAPKAEPHPEPTIKLNPQFQNLFDKVKFKTKK